MINDNDSYNYVGRAVFTPFGKVALAESSLDYPDSVQMAIGASGRANTLNDPTSSGELDSTTLGAELVVKYKGFNTVAEYYTRNQDRTVTAGGGDFDIDGGYLQVGFLLPNRRFEVAGRYSYIEPDAGTGFDELTESGVAFSYYASKHRHKVQLDVIQLENDTTPDSDTTVARVELQIAL